MLEKIKHNLRQYFGLECPYCSSKIENKVIDGEPTKYCPACDKTLTRVNADGASLFIGSIAIVLYLIYSNNIESANNYLFYRLIATVIVGFVFYIVPDLIIYIIGNKKIYK